MRILSDFLLVRSRVEMMARRNEGTKVTVANSPQKASRIAFKERQDPEAEGRQKYELYFQLLSTNWKLLISNTNTIWKKLNTSIFNLISPLKLSLPRITNRNWTEHNPSRTPPCRNVPATPIFKHFAKPKEAEKTESENVIQNWVKSSPAKNSRTDPDPAISILKSE